MVGQLAGTTNRKATASVLSLPPIRRSQAACKESSAGRLPCALAWRRGAHGVRQALSQRCHWHYCARKCVGGVGSGTLPTGLGLRGQVDLVDHRLCRRAASRSPPANHSLSRTVSNRGGSRRPFECPTHDLRMCRSCVGGPLLPDHLLTFHVQAAIGDGNSPEDAAHFAQNHEAWLRRLDLLENCVPSAQTRRRLAHPPSAANLCLSPASSGPTQPFGLKICSNHK